MMIGNYILVSREENGELVTKLFQSTEIDARINAEIYPDIIYTPIMLYI